MILSEMAGLHPKFWWYLARSSGVTAWVAAAASIVVGLLFSTKLLQGRPKPVWLVDLHRGLSGVTLAALTAHLVALVADSYVHFSLADLVVPFASDWRPGPVATGVLAMWILVVVEATSFAQRRMSRSTWHRIHLTAYAAGVLATVHAFTAGTDARSPAMIGVASASVGLVVFLVLFKNLAPRRRRAVAITSQ